MENKVKQLIINLLGELQEEATLDYINSLTDEYMSFAEDDIHTFSDMELQDDVEFYILHNRD